MKLVKKGQTYLLKTPHKESQLIKPFSFNLEVFLL